MPFPARLSRGQATLHCPNCAVDRPLDTSGWQASDDRRIEHCLLCGCRQLYRQRDFPRTLGCLLIAIGAVLVPWTYGLSLPALAGLDLILYHRLPDTVACYRCDTVYRDARPTGGQTAFDLLLHDRLRYGRSWAEPDGLSAGARDDSR